MIATPNDVQDERDVIREVIHEWNVVHSQERRAVLLPVGWETHSVPTIGERPQEALNNQMVRDCDLLVAVFWTRLGTDTGKAESGTVEEINEHVDAGKPAMLYFSNTPVVLNSIDQAQYAALTEFKNNVKGRSLYQEYGSAEEFKTTFTRQLVQKVQDTLLTQIPASDVLEKRLSMRTGISQDAQRLLLTTAGGNGRILCTRGTDATTFQAADKFVYHGSSHREIAQWDAAVRELLSFGLVNEDDDYPGVVFEMTQEGYQLADQLKQG